MIFRNDDVCPNTNISSMQRIYDLIKRIFKDSEIFTCVNMFARSNHLGSVYPGVPFKNQHPEWFYDVDRVLEGRALLKETVVSHGLLHSDHTRITKDAQAMSILTSCKYLGTDKFMPPFNRFNDDTIDICKENGIILIPLAYKWKSIEFESFDPEHPYWYFHSWRWDEKMFREKLLSDWKAHKSDG